LVPEEFVNQTYEKLFKHLLEKDLIAIGLYRLPGATDNKYPYVYTNPEPKTVITYKDRVFVLGKEIPNDLIIDVKKSKKNPLLKEKTLKSKSVKRDKSNTTGGGGIHDFYGSKNHTSNIIDQLNFNMTPRSVSLPGVGGRNATSSQGFRSVLSHKIHNSVLNIVKNSYDKVHPAPSGVAGGSPKIFTELFKKKHEKEKKKKTGSNMNDYDDSQDQINSLEFMHRSILALESKLGDIESKVAGIKKIIAKQD
jgi:hypothetical protein